MFVRLKFKKNEALINMLQLQTLFWGFWTAGLINMSKKNKKLSFFLHLLLNMAIFQFLCVFDLNLYCSGFFA